MENKIINKNYTQLIDNIGNTITNARENSYKTINKELIQSYWLIGKYIVEYEQAGNIKADYGANLLLQISKDLKIRYGKGLVKTTEENETNDNPPIGILLTREKDEVMIEYAMYNVDSNLFVNKYQLYLPNRDELKKRVENILNK